VPEYGIGTISFPDFLEIGIDSGTEASDYYKVCKTINLDRQVGSRYFVSAHNGAKILVLREAAVEYLKIFKKNKLEKDVYEKLENKTLMAMVKADALMFIYVYSDLVKLAKSTDLNKSAFDMRLHYLELDGFLEFLEDNPATIFNSEMRVFKSEDRLYEQHSKDKKKSEQSHKEIRARLFRPDPWDDEVLQVVTKGAGDIRRKLKTYAKDFLPGGKYWEPPENIRTTLQKLQPSNDICESILGLNDWLHGHSMHSACQLTKRNMVAAKKNKSMVWLDSLPSEQQNGIIEIATKKRVEVKENYKQREQSVKKGRQAAMAENMRKKIQQEKRTMELKTTLSKVLVLQTSDDFEGIIQIIDSEHTSTSKKTTRKKELIQTQVRLRKTLWDQNVKIHFTRGGKAIPIENIVDTFKKILDSNETHDVVPYDPMQLVGKEIQHKFYCRETKQNTWFKGKIMDYYSHDDTFKVKYEDEEEACFFNLKADYAIGDLQIM
jgi:hypothetical protein